MRQVLFFFFILAHYSCLDKPIQKEWKLKECVKLRLIPSVHYTPYNTDWIVFIENAKYQVSEIYKFRQNSIDSLILIKSDFVLSYGSTDIYNDTTLLDNFYRNHKRQIQITDQSLIDGEDTFRIKSLNELNAFVFRSDNDYRFYKFEKQ